MGRRKITKTTGARNPYLDLSRMRIAAQTQHSDGTTGAEIYMVLTEIYRVLEGAAQLTTALVQVLEEQEKATRPRKTKRRPGRPKKVTRAPENKSMKRNISNKAGTWVHDPARH